MSYFLRNGNTFRVSDKQSIDLHDKLPAGNYVVKADQFGNLYLEIIDSFEIPNKLYGNCLRHTDRILNTFTTRDGSTGVLLTGEKGSGKTLLAKNLASEAAKQGIPTIVINSDFCGDGFNTLIQDIDQPAVILFDEFEKVYGEEEQEKILTLLDGVFPTKKLFVLTSNDKWRINSHMRNRPGRIFYLLDFKGLTPEFITEYCNDNLNSKQYIDKICKIASLFDEFNFDMLKALVEDMNRYNEDPADVLEMLNAKPEYSSSDVEYTYEVVYKGKQTASGKWRGNPLAQRGIYIDVSLKTDEDTDEDEYEYVELHMTQEHLKDISVQDGKFTFGDTDATVTLTRKKQEYYNYYGAF